MVINETYYELTQEELAGLDGGANAEKAGKAIMEVGKTAMAYGVAAKNPAAIAGGWYAVCFGAGMCIAHSIVGGC